jgi:hypothetical protein
MTHKHWDNDTGVSRYLQIIDWAKRRYTDKHGWLVTHIGHCPTRYAEIERLAWRRHIAKEPRNARPA